MLMFIIGFISCYFVINIILTIIVLRIELMRSKVKLTKENLKIVCLRVPLSILLAVIVLSKIFIDENY